MSRSFVKLLGAVIVVIVRKFLIYFGRNKKKSPN